jgi:DNA-binding transcriptional LysR family regulator
VECIAPLPGQPVLKYGGRGLAFASAGTGIIRALSYQIDDLVKARSLVELLETYAPSLMPLALIYPSQRQLPLKLRAFLDFSIRD